jgi:S1-C subfamily serine protease
MIIRGPMADMELARLTPGLGRYFGTDSGVLVVHAPPHGALGLQDGDVILAIAGRKPIDSSHVIRILASYDPGEKIAMEVMRAHRRISITTRMPAEAAAPKRALPMLKGSLPGPDPLILSGDDRTL